MNKLLFFILINIASITFTYSTTCDLQIHTVVGKSHKFIALKDSEKQIAQWLYWEEQANVKEYRSSTDPFDLEIVHINAQDALNAKVDVLEGNEDILLFIQKDDGARWPKHPENGYSKVPYFYHQPSESVKAFRTASRSVVVNDERYGLFSVKMPTSRVHGHFQIPKATDFHDDIVSALVRSRYIKEMDSQTTEDEILILLHEVATVEDVATGSGYIIRDLGPLQDGNYYLPAFSIPFAGLEIAQKNNREFLEFWKENFAKQVGRAKAHLMLRYGIQMETPNAQNILIQLDKNFRPTGKIVFRDLSDSFLIDHIAKSIGQGKRLKIEKEIKYTPHDRIGPYAVNTMWRLEEDNELFNLKNLDKFIEAHDHAYADEVNHLLGTHFETQDILYSVQNTRGSNLLNELDFFLRTPQAVEAIKRYQKSIKRPSAPKQRRVKTAQAA